MARTPRPTRLAPLLLAPVLLGAWGRCASEPALPPAPTGPFQLVWADEFEGPAGTSPSSSHWTFDVGTGTNGWGNSQLEYDTARPENAALDGLGHLAIVARRESYGGMEYTSARMLTRGRHEATYGKFEARIQLPRGAGLWPAFWLLGANIGTVGWPACGELDVMEYVGQERFKMFSSVHGPGYSGGEAITQSFWLPSTGPGFDEGFHTFAVEWDPQRIVFLVDGVPFGVPVTPASLPAHTTWVFDHPFFIILNLAVGGTLGGPVAADTVFPATMLVD